MGKLKKLKPSQIEIDPRFNRDLDEARAKAMARNIEVDLIGVPVVSERDNGTFIALDGQHRMTACRMAGVDDLVYCEVHAGLSLSDEAALFLRLNGGRRPVRVFDKFKAQLVARDPVAMDISSILKSHGFRIVKGSPSRCGIVAIQALVGIYHRGNLNPVLAVVTYWADGEPATLEGDLLKAISLFLGKYPEVDLKDFGRRLAPISADRIIAKLKRTRGAFSDVSPTIAACSVFREIYNARRPKRSQLPPPELFENEEAMAAE